MVPRGTDAADLHDRKGSHAILLQGEEEVSSIMKTAVNPVVQATKVTNSEHATHARILRGGRLPFKPEVAVL